MEVLKSLLHCFSSMRNRIFSLHRHLCEGLIKSCWLEDRVPPEVACSSWFYYRASAHAGENDCFMARGLYRDSTLSLGFFTKPLIPTASLKCFLYFYYMYGPGRPFHAEKERQVSSHMTGWSVTSPALLILSIMTSSAVP